MAVSKKNIEELSELINNHVADLQRIGANWSDEILKELHQAQKEIMEFVISSQKNFGAVGIDAATNKKFEIIKKRIEQLLNQAYAQSLQGIQTEAKTQKRFPGKLFSKSENVLSKILQNTGDSTG